MIEIIFFKKKIKILIRKYCKEKNDQSQKQIIIKAVDQPTLKLVQRLKGKHREICVFIIVN